MEKLVSSWFDAQPLPGDYVFPPDKSPGKVVVPVCITIPVIDLGKAKGDDRDDTIKQILNASQDYGFFRVINHGVSEKLMEDTIGVCQELFDLPDEDKAKIFSDDPSRSRRLYTSINYAAEEVHLWRDNLRHPCHPLAEWINSWPKKPSRYRDVVGAYSVEERKLSLQILELMSQGLGLEPDYFQDESLTNMQLLSVNHYPPCPDPSSTLGLPKHCDPGLITILLQGDIYGLQVFKDEQWLSVQPLPNAFVVNIGYQLQILSNGKFNSAEHRAVTNSRDARTTIVSFISPHADCVIQPAKSLVDNKSNLPVYRPFQYKEFLTTYTAKYGDTETALEPFKL